MRKGVKTQIFYEKMAFVTIKKFYGVVLEKIFYSVTINFREILPGDFLVNWFVNILLTNFPKKSPTKKCSTKLLAYMYTICLLYSIVLCIVNILLTDFPKNPQKISRKILGSTIAFLSSFQIYLFF